jgi:hypothetical protein
MIRNNEELLDTIITYRILKGRGSLIYGQFGLGDIPEEAHQGLDHLNHAISVMLSDMWNYTDKIVTQFEFFQRK